MLSSAPLGLRIGSGEGRVAVRTYEYVVSNLHGVVVNLAAADPARRLDDTACRDDGAASNADACRRDFLS